MRGSDVEKADGVCSPASSYAYRFLDDTGCIKRTPSNRERDQHCPTVAAGGATVTTHDGRAVTYQPAGGFVSVDASALHGLVPPDLRVTLVLVRRVLGSGLPPQSAVTRKSTGERKRRMQLSALMGRHGQAFLA